MYPASLGLNENLIYYDQFMNKTYVEGMRNICW